MALTPLDSLNTDGDRPSVNDKSMFTFPIVLDLIPTRLMFEWTEVLIQLPGCQNMENRGGFGTFFGSKFLKIVNLSSIFIFCNFLVIEGNMNLIQINSTSFKVPLVEF